jgi:hypothetical protein
VKSKVLLKQAIEPIWLWDVQELTFSRQSAHKRRWGCQPYAPAALYSPGNFRVPISIRGWVNPRAIVCLEGLKSKSILIQLKSNDLIGIRTPDLLVCSIAPKTSMLLHTPTRIESSRNTGSTIVITEARGSVVVKELCYKPESCGFDTQWGEFFKFT